MYLPIIQCRVAVLVILIRFVCCSNAYEYPNFRFYSHAERYVRSQNAKNIRLEGLYYLKSSFNNLYLTARNGQRSPGSVVLKKWSDGANQLWGVIRFDTSKGYNIKPLANEFNFVTSTLKNNTHAYNAWDFQKQNSPNTYSIFTLDKKCLQTASLNEQVKFEKCHAANIKQHWKLEKVE